MKMWIRLDVAIASDPNVITVAERMKIPFAEAVGLCTLLWCQIAQHRPSGDISGLSISTLESWSGYEPRKGKPAGAFGALFLELFASEGMASGWRARQGALIERAQKEKDRWHRRNSAEAPENSASTVRNVTERTDNPQSVGGEVEGLNLATALYAARVELRTPQGIRYAIPKATLDTLSPAAQQALLVAGGAHELANAEGTPLRVMKHTFAKVYASEAA